MSHNESTPVPTLEHVLSTFAYHVSTLMTERPTRTDAPFCERARFGLGLGGYVEGCPEAYIEEVQIVSAGTSGCGEDPWGPWAQVSFDGKGVGNRHGAYKAYTEMCAPVIAWVAAYWARKEADPHD